MDEIRAEEKKNKTVRNRRIGLEIRFFITVTLLYMCIYLLLCIIPWFVHLFVPINRYIRLAIAIGLAFVTYILTSLVARSRGFIALVSGRH